MGSKYIVEVSADGAAKTADDLNKVATAEQRIVDIRAPKNGTPFDAVAEASARAAANAQNAAKVITTSTQEIAAIQAKAAKAAPVASGPSEKFKQELKDANKRAEESQKENARAAERTRLSQPGASDQAAGDAGFSSLGRFTALTAAAAAATKLVTSLQEAAREQEKLEKSGAEFSANLGRTISADPSAGLGAAAAKIREIKEALKGLDQSELLAQLESYAAFQLGASGTDFEKALTLKSQLLDIERQRAGAVEKVIQLSERETEVITKQLAGDKEGAELKARQIADDQKMLALRERIAAIPGLSNDQRDSIFEREQRKQKAAEELVQQNSTKVNAVELTALQTKLSVLKQIANHNDIEAAAIQRKAQLQAYLKAAD